MKDKLINLAVTLAVLAVFTVPGYLFADWMLTPYDDYPNPGGPAVACADKVKDEPRSVCPGSEIYQLAEGYEKDAMSTLDID